MPDIISAVKIVGRYELLDPIGQGGMAIVYLAHQTDLDRRVALKELRVLNAPDDPALAERFLREARMAGSMSHPNIVTVYEYFKHDGTPYIAMEYIRRGSLRPWLGRMTLAQIVGVMEGLLAALDHAQGYRIVHRDLKPENLLVTDQGQIKVADFGIAKARTMETNAFLTAVGTTVGTPTYMAPEQAMAQELGPYTDLYSVGVMAYEMLVGRAPFSDTSTPFAVVMRHLNEEIPSAYKVKPEIDRALSGWIDRLLIKDPARRTQTAEEAWDELEQFVVRLLGSLWRREARLVQTSELPSAQPLTPAPFASTDIETPVPEKRGDRSRGEDDASDGPDVSAPVSEPAFPTSEHRVPVARSPDLGAQLDDLAQPDAAQLDDLAQPDAPPAPALRPDPGFVTFDRNVRAPAREQLPDRSAQPVGLVTPPSVAQPVVDEPVVDEPVVAPPVVAQPVVAQPVVAQPVVAQPVVDEPVVAQPVVEQPVMEQPVMEQPVMDEPVMEQPVMDEPVVEQPVVEQPVVEAPAARRVQEQQPAPVREQPPAPRTADPPPSAPHDDPGLSRDMKAAPLARVPNPTPIAPYAPAEPSAPDDETDFETVEPFEFRHPRRADPPPAPPSMPRVSPAPASTASVGADPTPAGRSSAPARPAPARATSPAAPASRMSPPASSEPAQRASPPASPKRARKTSSAVGPKPAKRTSRTDPAAKAGRMRVGLTKAPDGEDHTIPDGEASAPAPATSPPRTPGRGDPGRRAMIGGGVAVLAVAGVAVVLVVGGGGGGGSAPPKTPAAINSHTVPLTTADLSLAAPTTWSLRADLPRIPGLDPNRAKAIARGRAYLAAELVPGATNPTLLPRDLLDRLKVKLPAPVKLTLGGNDAYRYDALQAHGMGAKLRVYTVLTNAGVATIACSSPATRADCDAVAKTLKLSSAQALPMGADRAYEAIVTSASTALDGAVATQNKGLDRAKTLRGKASALRKIGRAYAAAASLLGGPGARKSAQDAARTLNPVDAGLNSRLIKVFGKAASAYGKLATAVGRGDRRATDRSAQVAGQATRIIRATAGALNRAGYTAVPSVYPRTKVTLPARPTARSVTPPAATGPAPSQSQSHFTPPPPQSQTPPPPAAQPSTPPPPPPPSGSGSGSGGD